MRFSNAPIPSVVWRSKAVTRFWRNRHGNISLLAALMSVPMVAGLGFAIDYAVALSTKSKLDAAASTAAAIAASAAASAPYDSDWIQDLTGAQSTGQSTFLSQASLSNVSASAPTVSVKRYGNSYKASISYSAQQQTYFSALFGVQNFVVSGSAQGAASVRDYGAPTASSILFEDAVSNMNGTSAFGAGWTQRGNVTMGTSFTLGAASPSSSNKKGGRITKQIYLPAGTYHLRYWYKSNVFYPDYGSAIICGTTDSDVSWATATSWKQLSGTATGSYAQAARLEVYLDPATTDQIGSAILTPSTNNLVDVCVYAYGGTDREIMITVQEPGYYRLAFSTESNTTSIGAMITGAYFCKTSCPSGSFIEFPTNWSGSMFTETFESPSAGGNATNLNLSAAGTWASSFFSNSLYPSSGWIAGPYDQINIGTTSDVAAQSGSQHLAMHGTDSNGSNGVRNLYRRFLFSPGYYYLYYYYRGSTNMGGTAAIGGSWCGPFSQFSANDPRSGADAIKVGFDPDTLFLHPVSTGSVRATISWQPSSGYTPSPTQNVGTGGNDLEVCSYSDSWTLRKAYFKVEKPGYYWLYISPVTANANNGGRLDLVKVYALNGLSTGLGWMGTVPTVTTLKSHGLPIGTTIQLNKISIVQHS